MGAYDTLLLMKRQELLRLRKRNRQLAHRLKKSAMLS
jgi:hypothetical protein